MSAPPSVPTDHDQASRDTRRVVEELLTRIGEGDADRSAELYTEDKISWQLDWPVEEIGHDVPWIRERSTRADVADHFRTLAAHHDGSRSAASVDRIVVELGQAVVTGMPSNTITATGRSYAARFALCLTVANGLITSHHVYEDSLSVARAWYGS